jgi:hypothetical protein
MQQPLLECVIQSNICNQTYDCIIKRQVIMQSTQEVIKIEIKYEFAVCGV